MGHLPGRFSVSLASMVDVLKRTYLIRISLIAICVICVLAGARNLLQKPHKPLLAVIPETTAQEIWESEHAGAERAAAENGWTVYWNAPSREDDFTRQIQIVNQSIDRRADGLILAPDHAVALISPVRRALERKIPTVVVASPLGISAGGFLSYVLNDEEAMGKMAAQRAARLLGPQDDVLVLGVNPSLIASTQRSDAFERTLRALLPANQMEERRGSISGFAEAEEDAETAIRTNKNLRVIFALNVTQSRAAYAALQATGSVGRVALIACDQDLDLLHHLRSGGIDTILAQNTALMGYRAVQIIEAMRLHRPVPSEQKIPPVLVTLENVNQEPVQQVLNMDWRMGR